MRQSIITIAAMCLFCSVSIAGITTETHSVYSTSGSYGASSVHVRHKHVHRHRTGRAFGGSAGLSGRSYHRSVTTTQSTGCP